MLRSPLLDHHETAGARLAARPEAGELAAPLTFGDVPAEVATAREGCVVLDATDRGLLTVYGKDAASFLHRILANEVRALAPGTGNRNLLLSPKGKIVADFDLQVRESEEGGLGFELSTAPSSAAAVLQAIDLYLFGEAVTITDATPQHAPIELIGPRALETARAALGVEPPSVLGNSTRTDGVTCTRLLVAGAGLGLRIDGGPERAEELWNAVVEAGARPAGLVARDVLRVEACAALWGVDIDENVYPQEARLEAAFALDKGCYVGQEVVAKIDTYGGLNKRLMVLRVEHDDPVAPGTPLLLADDPEERELGLVTSWTYSFALDTGAVLAYVKRRHQDDGTRFKLGASEAIGEIVPVPRPAGA